MCFYQQFHSFNITFFFNTIIPPPPTPPATPESTLSKERLKGLKYIIGFGGEGGDTQRKGAVMSIMEKEAISQKCLNTFVPHCLNAKLCNCTQVKPCMTMILTEITGITDIHVIMLLVVTTTQMRSPRPDRVLEMPMGVQG